MVEEKKAPNFRLKGVFSFVPLTFQNSGKGEIGIRDEEGKEISLDKLWGRYLTFTDFNHPAIFRRWVNLDIELLDYSEEKDSNFIKEIMGRKKDYIDNIYENMEEDETEDIKIITKTERGTLFVRPYSFIDRMGWGEKVIIGYYRLAEFVDLFGKGSVSLSQLLEKFIDRKVILTLRMEALEEDGKT